MVGWNVALAAGTWVLHRGLLWAARLPPESYRQPLLFLEFLRHNLHGWTLVPLLLALPVAVIGLVHPRARWDQIEYGSWLRRLVWLCALLPAWRYGTSAFNAFYGQAYELDRVLLLLLAALIWWFPGCALLFLLVLLPFAWQFSGPVGGFSWAMTNLPAGCLAMFSVFLVLHLADRLRGRDFLFGFCCLLAAHYWTPGLEKLKMGWLAVDRIFYVLPASYSHGWLSFLAPHQLEALTRAVAWLNWPMKLFTLMVEAGALFFLWRRRVTMGFTVGFVLFHLGVFALTGIFFWTWIVIDLALFALLLTDPAPELYNRPRFWLSLVLIGLGPWWARPVALAWYDVPLTYSYRLEGVGASGASYSLTPHFFAPYDYHFTFGGFSYLCSEPMLPIGWGACHDRSLVEALSTPAAATVFDLEQTRGRSPLNPERRERFSEFLSLFVPARESGRRWWALVPAPPILWTSRPADAYDFQEPLETVRVHQVTALFDGTYREIRERPLLEVPIVRK